MFIRLLNRKHLFAGSKVLEIIVPFLIKLNANDDVCTPHRRHLQLNNKRVIYECLILNYNFDKAYACQQFVIDFEKSFRLNINIKSIYLLKDCTLHIVQQLVSAQRKQISLQISAQLPFLKALVLSFTIWNLIRLFFMWSYLFLQILSWSN